ncbi:hypothetical protein CYMTET_32250 [Cymbomonas tetramitiformis]|uniref:Uncharacterized protein n=1 Tax=Cymbomonas tetramitiformis TaxID=36881 RepID=A0AAE0FF78_9CHLO|nr:hypothetical protein CYMTET_32250 [Cymbomonas tetramitiformis]
MSVVERGKAVAAAWRASATLGGTGLPPGPATVKEPKPSLAGAAGCEFEPVVGLHGAAVAWSLKSSPAGAKPEMQRSRSQCRGRRRAREPAAPPGAEAGG